MRKPSKFSFLAGFVSGAIIFGGTAALAASIMATPTTSKVYVNNKEVKVEAYNINGRNYFQLRDMASTVDFSVIWDGANNTVLIDTSRGYDPNETLPAPTPVPSQTTDNAMTIDEMKAEIVRLTNIERANAGLPVLDVLPELMDCAQAKAQDFMDNHYFAHTSPVYGTPGEMIKAFVPRALTSGENLTAWAKTPTDAFRGWTDSPGHLKTMLNSRYSHIGIGIVEGVDGGYWWVQQFVQMPQY